MKCLIALVLLASLLIGCGEEVPIATEFSSGDEVRSVSGGVTPEYGDYLMTVVEYNVDRNKYKCSWMVGDEEKTGYFAASSIILDEEIDE